MILYTSDTVQNRKIRTAFKYLVISIALAAAGAIYEHFSFGVYSYYMIYAFMIPLAGGALPFMIMHFRGEEESSGIVTASEYLYHAAVATLTAGSIMHGALEICGRPNSLTMIYPVAAAVLILPAAVLKLIACTGLTGGHAGSSGRLSRQVYPRRSR